MMTIVPSLCKMMAGGEFSRGNAVQRRPITQLRGFRNNAEKRSPVSAQADVQTLGITAAFSSRSGERRIGTLTVVVGRADRQE